MTIDHPQLSKSEIKVLVASLLQKNITINPDQEMKYKEIENTVAYIYVLESLVETRRSSWSVHPYNGEPVHETTGRTIPDAWDVGIRPEHSFTSHSVSAPVPHSRLIRSCGVCTGIGSTDCPTCDASGLNECPKCQPKGGTDCTRTCSGCGIRRQLVCPTCCGSGEVTCATCEGHGSLCCTLMLRARFDLHRHRFISFSARDLPEHGMTDDTVVKILEESGDMVTPVEEGEFPDTELVAASQRIHNQHMQSVGTDGGRLIAQRQEISALPLTVARFKCRGKKRCLHIFGQEKKVVHFDKYPPTWSHLGTFRHSLSP